MNEGIVWRPTKEHLEQSNVARLIARAGAADYRDLLARSSRDVEWFWRLALDDLGVEWARPYDRVLDDSRGLPWCRWFQGGLLNVVHNCVDRHARANPGAAALLWEGDGGETRRVTYGELAGAVDLLAGALRADGIRPGDGVGFFMPMVPELVVALFAVFKVGAVAVPVFSAYGPDALAVRLQDAGARLLFTADGSFRRGKQAEIKPVADAALRQAACVRRVVVLRRTGAEVAYQAGRDVTWDEFVRNAVPERSTDAFDPEHRCLVVYTSGTTGRPKGAVHTHGGVLAQVAKELAYNFDVRRGDRFFWLTDIGWMMGPWEIVGATFLGASVLIFEGAPNWPQPDRLWRLVERHRLTHLGVSPTAVRVLMRSGDEWVRGSDVSTLRILGSTGEPWDPESYEWLFRNAGRGASPIINISGGTEVMGSLVACAPAEPLKPCAFQGPGLGMDVDVVDDGGNPVRGSVGYLVIRKPAPSMTRGFLNDPERYMDTYFSRWPGIWYHGDWARIDGDGFWFIHGRADDTIKVGGKRTGPAEIESALMRHPAVAEAAAIGVPDEVKGEAVVCFVVIRPGAKAGALLEREISDVVAAALGKTLRPRSIHVVAALPKTRSAKIVRGAIKRRYLGLPDSDVSSVENPEALDAVPRGV